MEDFHESHSLLRQADIEFCDLYFKAIWNILDMSDHMHTMAFRRYMELLRFEANANCEFYENDDPAWMELFMDNLFYRLAYVYRNGTVLSSAVAFHFQNVLKDNPSVLEHLFQKQKVRICSIGGGPGSDVVGLVQVLESLAEMRGLKNLDIRITVVDSNASWRNTCFGVLRCIPMFSDATWKIKFVQTDLSQFFTAETVEAISQADVVSLVKFSSEFVGGYLSCKDTIEAIFEILHPKSLLFFLDRPNTATFRSCGGRSGSIKDFQLVYEEIYDLYTLHLAAVQRNYHLYWKHLGDIVFNTCFKVFARAWTRSASMIDIFTRSSDPQDITCLKRFCRREGKFDVLKFFREQPYAEWDLSFYERMDREGWGSRRLQCWQQKQRNMWDSLCAKWKEDSRSLEDVEQELADDICEPSMTVRECNWKEYFHCKRNFGFTTRLIYCETVINFRGYLKKSIKVSETKIIN